MVSGATKAETITKVVLPAALPGIVSAVLLGVSRAIGETMIVVMAAGQGASPHLEPIRGGDNGNRADCCLDRRGTRKLTPRQVLPPRSALRCSA